MKMIYLFFVSALMCIFTGSCATKYYENPVINMDVPDPSVIRVGETYYAAGTSGDAQPVYPIFKSDNLVDWTPVGHIFNSFPKWTKGAFWAPELYQHKDKTFCYYTAKRKSDGISCIGVAVADRPEGPYVDHGMLLDCDKEAIDAYAIEVDGQLWVVYKAYGLNPERPIELLAQRLTSDGLNLEGAPVSLLADMENIGMEGESIFKSGEYFYILYAARDCCSPKSDYEVRVARSKSFTGPYEKYKGNPILVGDGVVFQSAGHGTQVVTPSGRMYYLCHAYEVGKYKEGRKPVLHELKIGTDGWPHFVTGTKTQHRVKIPEL
jgi:xylan 1,4-beta-xylosidase